MALTEEQLADIRSRIPARPETDIPMPYEDLVRKILTEGTLKSDRTGTGTISLFGQQMRFDLSKYFPLLTTKTVFFKGLAYELLWFLKGSSNINWLLEHNVHIWDEWADENGDLGPVYGVQWRSWPAPTPEDPNRTIDQISNVLDLIKHHPDSRRMIVSAWNPAEVEKMALPPCHALFQFYVADDKLSCQLYQRSCDMFLGVPFNIASYSLLTMMMAQQAGLKPGEFVWTGGDCHVYDNHVDQFLEQLGRKPYPYPTIEIRKADSLFDYQYETSRSSATSITPLLRHLLRSDADYRFVDSEYCEGDGPRVFAVHYTKAQFRNPGGVSEMEHDSSRSGYHEPEPGSAGLSATEEDWGDDYPKTFSVNLIWAEARDKEGRAGAIGLNGGMPCTVPRI